MRNIPHRIAYGLAAATVALLTSCSNGDHLKNTDRDTTIVSDDLAQTGTTGMNNDKEVMRLLGLINDYQSIEISDSTPSQERMVFQRQLDELFGACSRQFETLEVYQQENITDSLTELFTNNTFANDYAYRNHSSGICGAIPTSPIHR